MERLNNWINGAATPPTEPVFLPKLDPLSREGVLEVARSGEMDVVLAVRAAHQGLKAWSRTEDRASVLTRLLDRLSSDRAILSQLAARETGRPIKYVEPDLRELLRNLESLVYGANRSAGGLGPLAFAPVGVVAMILSWRDPWGSLLSRVVPALLYGNAVVIKPSLLAPLAAVRLGEILHEVGLPAGTYNVVHGTAAPVGRFLAQHPGIARVAFSGTSSRGQEVLAETAKNLKPTHTELSRKNTIIVLKDAEVPKMADLLARAAVDGYPKILVQDELYPALSQSLAERLSALRVGTADDATTDVGPVISEKHLDLFNDAIATVRKEDGRILCGGDGENYRPVLVGELTNCSEIHQTDLSGPLVTINTFKYVTDAVKWANNTPFGHAVSVWTKNLNAVEKLGRELDFGAITLNGFTRPWEGPQGLKNSGTAADPDFYRCQKRLRLR